MHKISFNLLIACCPALKHIRTMQLSGIASYNQISLNCLNFQDIKNVYELSRYKKYHKKITLSNYGTVSQSQQLCDLLEGC